MYQIICNYVLYNWQWNDPTSPSSAAIIENPREEFLLRGVGMHPHDLGEFAGEHGRHGAFYLHAIFLALPGRNRKVRLQQGRRGKHQTGLPYFQSTQKTQRQNHRGTRYRCERSAFSMRPCTSIKGLFRPYVCLSVRLSVRNQFDPR